MTRNVPAENGKEDGNITSDGETLLQKMRLKPDMVYWILNMVVKPIIAYAALVWAAKTTKQQ